MGADGRTMEAIWSETNVSTEPAPLPELDTLCTEDAAQFVQSFPVSSKASSQPPTRPATRSAWEDGSSEVQRSKGISEFDPVLCRPSEVQEPRPSQRSYRSERSQDLLSMASSPAIQAWTRPDIKHRRALALLACLVLALLAPIIVLASQAWDRCDSGPSDPPIALLKREDWSSDQVLVECTAGLILTLYSAAVATFAILTGVRRELDRAACAFGGHIMLQVAFISLHTSATGMAECEAGDVAEPEALRTVLRLLADLCYAGAFVAMQAGIVMKITTLHCQHAALVRRLYTLWLVALVLMIACWSLLESDTDTNRLLLVGFGLVWLIVTVCFASIVVLDLMRLRSNLASDSDHGRRRDNSSSLWATNRSLVERMLVSDALAIVSKTVCSIALVVAVAFGRPNGSAAPQNIVFCFDFIVSVVCGLALSGVIKHSEGSLHEDVVLAELRLRLSRAQSQIQAELGYDVSGRTERIAMAVLHSFNSYGVVLADTCAREPLATKEVCCMQSLRIHKGRLVPKEQIPTGPERDTSLDQPEACAQMANLLEEARAAQKILKDRLAPGSIWAEEELDSASLQGLSHEEVQEKRLLRESSQLVEFLDGAYDPGVKRETRIKQKARHKYGGNLRRVHDVARLAVFCDSMERVQGALPRLLECFDVVEVENRFGNPTPLGWMDITLLVRIPVSLKDGRIALHIAEIQLQLTDFYEARLRAHKYYRVVRSALGKAGVKPTHLDVVQTMLLDAIEG